MAGDIPDQTINSGQSFEPINLDDYVSDSNHSANEITWSVEGDSNVTVDIDINRVADIKIRDSEWIGREVLIFTAKDPAGLTDSDSVAFTVNPAPNSTFDQK